MTRVRSALCGIVLLALAALDAFAAEPRRVLLLHSFGSDYSPWGDMAASLRTELVKRSRDPIDLYEASIFTARFENPAEEGPFAEYLRSLFAGRKLDLVIAMGAPATYFVQRHRAMLFATTPVLIVGMDVRRIADGTLTANDTVVGVNLDLAAYVDNILRVLPDTTDIEIVIGNSPLEQYWIGEMHRAFEPFTKRVTLTWLNLLTFDKMLERAANLKPRVAILYFIVSVDAAGAPYVQGRAIEKLREVANGPIFGLGDYDFGRGIVGGPLLQTQLLGQQAAAAAIRIFGGEPPSSVKIEPIQLGTPVYDWRELRRWDISEARLPPHSVVQYREATMWQQYRWQITLAVAALLLQSALITGLLYEHRRRRSAEFEARRRMGELALVNRRAAIGEMSASIAHEIKQPLSAIVTNSDVGQRWLAKLAPNSVVDEASAALKRIVNDAYRANKVIDSVRGMFKKDDAGRALLDVNDEIRDVLALLRIELEEYDITVRTALSDGAPRVLASRIQLQQVMLNLARNAIEAMSTVTDRPRTLKLSSAADAGELMVTIEDNGPGVEPEVLSRLFEPFVTTKSNGMGMGLSICRSIVESHGGQLSVVPAKPHGAVFELKLPLN
jgi:signal transduction histidine kinase